MSEQIREQISAFLDGELPGAETELLLKRLLRDKQLRDGFGRYALIGEAMRGSQHVTLRRDFASDVSGAIDSSEPAQPAAQPRRAPRAGAGGGGVAGAAVAASVAVVAVVALQQRTVAPAGIAAAGAAHPVVVQVRPAGAAQLVAKNREPLSYTVPDANGAPPNAIPGARLTNYVFAHSQYSSLLGQRDVMTGPDRRRRPVPARGQYQRCPMTMRMAKPAPLLASYALLGFGVAAVAQAATEGPREWLEKMNTALATRNYDGTFLHLSDGHVETMRILHRVRGGRVTERLMSLDGSGREFVRNNDELTCYLPDKNKMLVEPRQSRGPLLGTLPQFGSAVDQFYRLEPLPDGRVLGRAVHGVAVSPKDQFRFGYRLWLDEQTAMPLKTQLCDSAGHVIEQIQFAHLDMPDSIPDSALKPSMRPPACASCATIPRGVPRRRPRSARSKCRLASR